MNINLPNKITIGRILLAVVFFVLLAQYSQRAPAVWILDLAAGLFIVAALTDFVDGYLARKRNQVTALGRILDPLADKLLVCGAFVLLCGTHFVDATGHNVTEVAAWMVVVIVGRELLVTGLRGFNESVGRPFGASIHGKIKMWTQSIAAPVILLMVAHGDAIFAPETATWIKRGVAWITVVVTALSMVQYLIKSRYILDEAAS